MSTLGDAKLRPLIAHFDLNDGPLAVQEAMDRLGVQEPERLLYTEFQGVPTLIHDPLTMTESLQWRYRMAIGDDGWKVLMAMVGTAVRMQDMVNTLLGAHHGSEA